MMRDLAPGRLSILFLDDDPFGHATFARDARGHRVDYCWFVDDAMERLLRGPYDLASLDHHFETEGFGREGREVAGSLLVLRRPHGRSPSSSTRRTTGVRPRRRRSSRLCTSWA